MRKLKCMNLNVNGALDVKLGSIDFVEQMCEYDIVLLSETWTDKYTTLDVTGFSEPICNHRVKKKEAKRNSGGLVCYFKD